MSVDLASFVLSHYAFLAGLALFSYLLGARATRSLAYHSAAEKFSFCTALGLGLIASAVFVLGLLQVLNAAAILAVFATASVLLWPCGKESLRELAQAWRKVPWARRLSYGVLAALVSPVLLLPLYPPVDWDATSYHLAAAKIYVQRHALVPASYLRFPVFPQLNEMLFTLALLLYDDLIAQLVQFLMTLVVASTLYAWGHRVFNSRAGLWAAALWISNPLVLWLGTSAYVDVGLAMFLALAVHAFFNWLRCRSDGWLLLSAVLFGFSAAEKYLALFPILVVGLLLSYLSLKDRAVWRVLAFGAILLVVAGPWYLRTAYYTGNPVWPYWGSWLGYGPWTAEDASRQMTDLFGQGGKGALEFLVLPWNLTFHASMFHTEHLLSPVYLFLLPLLLVAAIRDANLRALLVAATLYTLFWFLTAQQVRYLVPALPLLSLAVATSLERYLFRSPWIQRPPVATVLTGMICVLLAIPGASRMAGPGGFGSALTDRLRSLPPVTAVARDDYIREVNPLYSAVEWLNRTRGSEYTLYTLACSNLAYYADGRFLGDWFGPARYADVLEYLAHPEELYRRLRRLGAEYFLVNQAGWGDFADPLLLPGSLRGHLKLVRAGARSGLLFELQRETVHVAASPELANNRGFEQLSGGTVADWVAVGQPLVDTTGANSYSGTAAVRCDEQNWLAQKVPVRSRALYVLRRFSRGVRPGQSTRLQINWLDREGKMAGVDIRVVSTDTDWQSRAMAVAAPESASWAVIHASVHGASEAWFDDFSFTELIYD